ncbi:MAG: hypothetical protein CMG74_00555 [Candidatus Marinimicrobia bacterium]|nr:hypothetical protein [Candidatus Neomarinimicrobiota bacterium]
MGKNLLSLSFLFLSICYSEIGYPGFHSWTSPSRMALGGSGHLSWSPLSSSNNPSTISEKKIFSTGLIRYPAGITSQNFATNFPVKYGYAGISIYHLSYGSFDGYDHNSNPTRDYYSSDTWIKTKFSNNNNSSTLKYGSAITLFSSNLDTDRIRALLVSAGAQIHINKINTFIGIGIKDFKLIANKFAERAGVFTHRTTLSLSKNLLYLPMKIFIDAEFFSTFNKGNVYIGGQANITSSIQFLFGTSTKKIDHNINQDLWKTVFGASGFGIVYNIGETKIIYGAYVFGTGVIQQGIELEITF